MPRTRDGTRQQAVERAWLMVKRFPDGVVKNGIECPRIAGLRCPLIIG